MLSVARVLSRLSGSVAISHSAVVGRFGVASYGTQPIAVVTGGAQGIGYMISERLIQEGYRVCLADKDVPKLEVSLKNLQVQYGNSNVLGHQCDVTAQHDLEDTLYTIKKHGHIALLVNNAGIVDEYDVEKTIDVNLIGTIKGCKLALQYLGTSSGRITGTVINVGSIPSFLPYPNAPVYVATKHAIIGLTRSYGHDSFLKRRGVIFMALCPLYVNTPLLHSAKPLDVFKHTTAMKYLRSEEVGDGISQLLEDRINGSALLVLHDKMEYVEIPDQLKNIPFHA